MNTFDASVVAGVTAHMNGDHSEDNLLIARAFGCPAATRSEMIDLDGAVGVWRVHEAGSERDLRVEWPGGPIAERPQIRREVVRLYQEACARLGVAPREEHRPEAERPAEAEAPAEAEEIPFSRILREGTWSDHSDSEGAGFMERIMRGVAPLDDYTALVAQHYFMYEALESEAARFSGEPLLPELHPSGLHRLTALEVDLRHLLGEDWRDRIEVLPAVERYADRIREVGADGWFAGYVAHHYTRYLGDLSGGQMIARRVARQHGLTGRGAEFYAFPELGDLGDFKNAYRAGLDRLGARLDAAERERMIEEVRRAYRCNTEAFADLARARVQAA